MSDVMHGPKLRHGRTRRKSSLIAFIDDATRVVPLRRLRHRGERPGLPPRAQDALIRRGIPQRLYVDNGANYRSRQLALVCAKLGIALIHARPYQPAGKGKTERWFRTLQTLAPAGSPTSMRRSAPDNLQTLNREKPLGMERGRVPQHPPEPPRSPLSLRNLKEDD